MFLVSRTLTTINCSVISVSFFIRINILFSVWKKMVVLMAEEKEYIKTRNWEFLDI